MLSKSIQSILMRKSAHLPSIGNPHLRPGSVQRASTATLLPPTADAGEKNITALAGDKRKQPPRRRPELQYLGRLHHLVREYPVRDMYLLLTWPIVTRTADVSWLPVRPWRDIGIPDSRKTVRPGTSHVVIRFRTNTRMASRVPVPLVLRTGDAVERDPSSACTRDKDATAQPTSHVSKAFGRPLPRARFPHRRGGRGK